MVRHAQLHLTAFDMRWDSEKDGRTDQTVLDAFYFFLLLPDTDAAIVA